MKRLYFFPPRPKGGYPNPYCQNFKNALSQHYQVLDNGDSECGVSALGLLRYSFRADVYVLNWIENMVFHRLGCLQFAVAFLALCIITVRRKPIVWVLHNIVPHQGHTFSTRFVYRFMFRYARLVIAHSREAEQYAVAHAHGRVVYECHPIVPIDVNPMQTDHHDLLIWGTIDPYKGVVEFISSKEVRDSHLDIMIAGRCKDKDLERQIDALTNEHIRFENRRVSFDEIAGLVRNSRYVVFPYIGNSISSSGVLIDTLVLGGTPIGPDKGAFRDLADEGVCLIYRDFSHLLELVAQHASLDNDNRTAFLANHTWKEFASHIHQLLEL